MGNLIKEWDKIVSKSSRKSLDLYNNIMASTAAGLIIAFATAFHETKALIFLFLLFPYICWRALKKILKKDKRMDEQIQLKNYILNYSVGIITGLYLSCIIFSIGKPYFIFKALAAGIIFMIVSLILITIIAITDKNSSRKSTNPLSLTKS